MSALLETGREYRRQELHDDFGGQRFGRISTPAKHPIVLLFAGESGQRQGYRDGFRQDGIFQYIGEGQVGDMEMKGGNLAIRDHLTTGKALHLFEILRQGRVRDAGEATYLDHSEQRGPDKHGHDRRVLVFELGLQGSASGGEAAIIGFSQKRTGKLWKMSLRSLREGATRTPRDSASKEERKQDVYARSECVRVYVLRRAGGICEGCGKEAPFLAMNERPFLETHHMRRVADGGPDHPRWVIALCPNCHQRVHHGKDGSLFNQELALRVAKIEGEIR